MKRNGTREELLAWLKINMEYTQNTIIDLNSAIHDLKMTGKDNLNLGHVLRSAEIYLRKYLQDQEDEYSEFLNDTKQSRIKRPPAKIYQFQKR